MNLRSTLITKQTVFIVIIGLILGAGIWYFMIAPANAANAETHAELDIKRANAAQLRAEVSTAQGGEASDVETDFEQASQVESILRPDASRNYREFLLAYMPVFPQTLGIEIVPTTPPPPTSTGEGASYIDYAYTFDSSWAQLQAFLQAVHELPLLATVEQFTTQETGSAGVEQWSTQVTVRVWWSDLEPLPGYDSEPIDVVMPTPPVSAAAAGTVDVGTTGDGTVDGGAAADAAAPPTTQPVQGSVSQGAVSTSP